VAGCYTSYSVFFCSKTSLIGPLLGPTMGGPINGTLINVAIKETSPINKVEACCTSECRNLRQKCLNEKSTATHCDFTIHS